MKAFILLTFGLLASLCVNAQTERLEIGDELPALPPMQVYQSSPVQLKDFQEQILILDFWGTTCTVCIKSMPKLADLQKKFGDKIKIILVAKNTEGELDQFFSKRKDLLNLKLPILHSDSLLFKLFPWISLPQIIWMGKDRKVKAMSSGSFLNEKNLQLLVESGMIKLPVKKDIIDFDYQVPLLSSNDMIPLQVKYNAIITTYLDGLKPGYGFTEIDSARMRLYAINMDIPSLYRQAYRGEVDLSKALDMQTNVIWKVKDSSRIFLASLVEKISKYYCYELILPRTGNSAAQQKFMRRQMQSDLDRFFSLRSKASTIEMDCYVLRVSKKGDHSFGDSSFVKETIKQTMISRYPPGYIVAILKSTFPWDHTLVYEGDDSRLSVILQSKYSSIDELRADLSRYGLEIVKAKKMIKVLEIEDAF